MTTLSPPSPAKCASGAQKRGFSLIEAAVVLGVVGLVIGGVWVAATAVNDKIKWNQTQAGWLYYVDYISKTYTKSLMNGASVTDVDLVWRSGSPPFPDGWKASSAGCCSGAGGPVDPYGNMMRAQILDGAYSGYISLGSTWSASNRDFCAKFMQFMYTRVIDKLMSMTGAGPSCSSGSPGPTQPYGYYYNNCCASSGFAWYLALPN